MLSALDSIKHQRHFIVYLLTAPGFVGDYTQITAYNYRKKFENEKKALQFEETIIFLKCNTAMLKTLH